MSIVGSEQWMYSSGAEFYDFPIEQSLRFNDDDNAYLSRTPASAGNRKTWTFSCWVKRGKVSGTDAQILTAYTSASDTTNIIFQSGGAIQWYDYISGYRVHLVTNALYRDVGAWYHLLFQLDTSNATSGDRAKIYVNGERVTSFSTEVYPSLNADLKMNTAIEHRIGDTAQFAREFDGYMAEVNFIDGTAYDESSFGETKSGIWVPKDPSGLTYGTNGFRLNFGDTVEANGFNTVTYTGNGSSQSVSGVGFSSSPDFVWIKERSSTSSHILVNSVRGANKLLSSNTADAEQTDANKVASLDSDGFSLGSSGAVNQSGQTYVAWCWDAGSGSSGSNTDGTITSTVKANQTYGFSTLHWTGTASAGTVGHGLSSAPEMIIAKNGSVSDQNWQVFHASVGSTFSGQLQSTTAFLDRTYWNDTDPTSSVFSISGQDAINESGNTIIAYCFHSVTGYSKFGSFVGTGAAGNSITTGFKPSFVLWKSSTANTNWTIADNTRDTSNPITKRLIPNLSNAEDTSVSIDFNDTGFEFNSGQANDSGETFIYMAFADTRDAAFWRDVSGQGNDWQPNNLTFSDVVPDGTNNFAVWSPLAANSSAQFKEGNLEAAAADNRSVKASFNMPSGKWYWENRFDGGQPFVGICPETMSDSVTPNSSGTDTVQYYFDGRVFINAVSQGNIGAWTTGDIIGITFDASIHQVTFFKNNTQVGQYTAPDTDKIYVPFLSAGSINAFVQGNFGQDSTFAGNEVAGGNADENGYGDFAYSVPSGFLSLCSANLPTGAIDTLADETPDEYFNTVLWTGDATNPRTLTGVGFEPSFSWLKSRSQAFSHRLYDAVRGAGNVLFSNATSAESSGDAGGELSAFTSDGFTTSGSSNNNNLNGSGYTYVAWNWKAGGAGVSNTDGSITSTVSVSETSQGVGWFSVVGFTTQAGGYTVGHGLGQKPSLIITKNRDTSGGAWYTFTDIIDGSVDYLALNQTSAKLNDPFGLANPTSSVFSLDDDYIFGSGDCIAYCFANAEGLCKVGGYNGNGSATDGTFVYLGFRPKWLMIKRTNTSDNWVIDDATRSPFNEMNNTLYANLSNAEYTGGVYGIDFLSNGFKARTADGNYNNGTSNYVYLAIAEQPFKYSNAR